MTAPQTAAIAEAISRVRALYVHVPFCERKCEYCDFASLAGRRDERAYADALRKELAMLGDSLPGLELDTVFFGGGTPSFVEPGLLAELMREVRADFSVSSTAEITLEANPSSTSEERAAVWRDAGFNRVSIGIQSLEPECLRFLGRVHDPKRAADAVAEVRSAGFDNVSCDLIYAIPGLGDAAWRRTLERVTSWQPAHLSCYELTVEPRTPLHAAVRRGAVRTVAPERALAQHWLAVDTLREAGYSQYEVSNFARPGRESRHNLVYWRRDYYLGVGVGAHGHLPSPLAAAVDGDRPDGVAVRYWHGRGLRTYVSSLARGVLPVAGLETVDRATHEVERIMLGLRLTEGTAARSVDVGELRGLVADGLLTVGDGRMAATRRGQEVLDQVILRASRAAADPEVPGAVAPPSPVLLS